MHAFTRFYSHPVAIIAALAALAVAAADVAPFAPTVASVTVSPATASGRVGDAGQFTATVRDSAGNVLTDRVVTWSSSNTAVVTVDQTGFVRAVGGGSATVTATSEGKSGQSQVTVTSDVASVEVSPASVSGKVGDAAQFTATVRDAGGNVLTGRVVTWSSSNTAVVTVDQTGFVRAVGAGSATVTATSEGKSGHSQVTIAASEPPPPPPPSAGTASSVQVSPATAVVIVAETQEFSATARDGAGNIVACTPGWTSSNTMVAQVDQTGLATTITEGMTTIIATCGTVSGSATLTVEPEPATELASLKTVPVPEPENLAEFVQDKAAAIVLGKALFWDMQVGGDGVQACASCHFHAFGDNRRKNQLNPATLAGDVTFQLGGANYTVRPRDFPFTKHEDELAPNSRITRDVNDVMSSQGVFKTQFVFVAPPNPSDICDDVRDPVFHVNGVTTRRVEPRNAPTAINAVFNFRNFWDGRANNNFNGQSVFGQRDQNAKVFRADASGNLEPVSVVIPIGSLASQAVGPPLSDFEMSCAQRFFATLGEKLLDPAVIPLVQQRVHPNDGVLGRFARARSGVTFRYADAVRAAFRPEWWISSELVTILDEDFTQMEANFALFFGLAVQLYEATLVSDDTRFDRFMEGQTTALTDLEKQGLGIFQDQGRCQNCHGGGEMTNASVRNVSNQRLERMIMGDGGCAIYDNGFYNIGVRPTAEDLGLGGTDPFGNPLSETRLAMLGKFFDPNLDPPLGAVPECDGRANVDGTFKTPGLRNVELTGPYFHNGGKGTLRQAVEFYNRGGDFARQNINNLDPDIQPLGLTSNQIGSVVAFLQALTDERVRQDQAPFDHPQLFRPQGHPGDHREVVGDPFADPPGGRALDDLFEVPAIGAGGRPELGLNPLQPFLTVTKMTGSGKLGQKREEVHFDLKFRVRDAEDAGSIKLRVREDARKVRIETDVLDRYFTTETCLEASGPATVNKTTGFRYELKTCDNGQPGHEDDDGDDDDNDGAPRGRSADTFDIVVTGPNGVVFRRGGSISGGNVHAHIR